MQKLIVWLRKPNGERVQVGELLSSEPDPAKGGRLEGEFRYFTDYLSGDDCFALDPIHLPLQKRVFSANRPYSGIHGVFEDSLPDDWGRKILVQRYKLSRQEQRASQLLSYLASDSLGALSYTTMEQWPEPAIPPYLPELGDLILAAERFENNVEEDDDESKLKQLFQAASSPGGARPKVILQHKHVQWLAKLPSNKDQLDIVKIEAATLELAQMAQLNIPDFFVQQLENRSALIIKRFDVTYPDNTGLLDNNTTSLKNAQEGRNHVISLQSLLSMDGFYTANYSDIADMIRKVSAQPEIDIQVFYRQMLFNAMIGNTDDHLKNFSMYHALDGWQLTPAYDLLPDIENRREHVLNFAYGGLIPKKNDLIILGQHFGLTSHSIKALYCEVREIIENWQDVYHRYEINEQEVNILSQRIQRRLKLV